ncbi:MAG: RNA methyltransferase [Treponema sp.]|nr:RNA methyltransferase [Candidatus Treponema caballi]
MKNKRNNELAICGFEAVKALEKNNPDAIRRLYFTEDRAPLFGGLCKSLAKKRIPYNQVEAADLEKLCGSVHHQGVVAMIDQPAIEHLSKANVAAWIENGENALLLDRIGNANNLGAIIRSAAFFGVKNIVIPLDEAAATVTTSTYRVAKGGMERVKVWTVQSMTKLLADLKGRMVRFGTDVRCTTPISSMAVLCEKKNADGSVTKLPAAIVLGNEEHGISDEIKENCDHLVIIPSPADDIESLNVAQAAAIILYELTR